MIVTRPYQLRPALQVIATINIKVCAAMPLFLPMNGTNLQARVGEV